jgi:hypothetical protein
VLDPFTSQIVAQNDVAIPISGSLRLRLGRPRASDSDVIPVTVRTADVGVPPLSGPRLRCLCIRAIADAALPEGISGRGSISCMGGLAGVNVGISIDHNTNTQLIGAVLAIDPITTGVLYAASPPGGIFKSTDAGATWKARG